MLANPFLKGAALVLSGGEESASSTPPPSFLSLFTFHLLRLQEAFCNLCGVQLCVEKERDR